MLVEFVEAFRFLARTPGAGHKREDLAEDRPILFWTMRDYMILYRPGTNPLEIITIVRGTGERAAISGSKLAFYGNVIPTLRHVIAAFR